MSASLIRKAEPGDFERIVELNKAEVAQTSAMNAAMLTQLHGLSCYHKVAVVEETVAAFLLAMREGVDYRNDNYGYFASGYDRFLYVDRVVVDKSCLGLKIGSTLYLDLFSYARANGIPHVCCEYNIEPPNIASKHFHERFGFREVAQQRVAGGNKLVSLQVARL